jgi:hypothetical protein
MASVSRSLDLAGSHWGLRKKTQRQTYRKAWDWVGPALLMRDAGNPLRLQVHLFIQQVWESGVKGRLGSHRSSRVGSRNSTAVVCCYLLQTILCQHALFSLQGTLLNLASPWLDLCLSAKGPFDRAVLVQRSISTASVSSLLLAEPCLPPSCQCQGFAFSAQRTLTWHDLADVKVSSQSIWLLVSHTFPPSEDNSKAPRMKTGLHQTLNLLVPWPWATQPLEL